MNKNFGSRFVEGVIHRSNSTIQVKMVENKGLMIIDNYSTSGEFNKKQRMIIIKIILIEQTDNFANQH